MKQRLFQYGRHKLSAALVVSATSLVASLASVPARAQFYGPPVLQEDAVMHRLRQQGFRRLTPPTLNGTVYYLDGADPNGAQVRIIVSARDARILALHPQRDQRWTRVDPDEDDAWPRRSERYGERWRDRDPWQERQSRAPEGIWRDDDWFDRRRRNQPDPWRLPPGHQLPQIDGGAGEDPLPDTGVFPPPGASGRRSPERITVAPLPTPAAPRDPELPAPTLKNPTVVKRSPTAIPKEPGAEKAGEPDRKPSGSASRNQPGAGTKQNPRVIELAPKAPEQAGPTAPAAPAPTRSTAAPPQPAPQKALPPLPPPAVLEPPAVAPKPEVPAVPPAVLE